MQTAADFNAFVATATEADLYLALAQGLLAQAQLADKRSARLYAAQYGGWTPRLLKAIQDGLLARGYRVGYHAAQGWPQETAAFFAITLPPVAPVVPPAPVEDPELDALLAGLADQDEPEPGHAQALRAQFREGLVEHLAAAYPDLDPRRIEVQEVGDEYRFSFALPSGNGYYSNYASALGIPSGEVLDRALESVVEDGADNA